MSADPIEQDAVDWLLSAAAVRARAREVLALAEEDRLEHLRLRPQGLVAVAERVEAVTRRDYPDLAIPYHSRWRHFTAGGVDRLAGLGERLAGADPAERARAELDLVVTSVLLDAGAGPDWSYAEAETGRRFARSEGLAVASLRLFGAGAFSSDPERPLQADAAGLQAFDRAALADGFQVGPDNPLVGLEGRAAVIRRLGEVVAADDRFAGAPRRVGNLFDRVREGADGERVEAADLLALVLRALGPIWPGRLELGGVPLGDVWPHPLVGGDGPARGLVPFHKLSQWLTYSLLEPLERAGLTVAGLDALTGLPEYRNGGLLLDLGALEPVDPGLLERPLRPDSPAVVEWRALTVALLDDVAERVRDRLGLDAAALPLAKVLQGGTWTAGREVARERRPDGGPPLRLDSDGTVF